MRSFAIDVVCLEVLCPHVRVGVAEGIPRGPSEASRRTFATRFKLFPATRLKLFPATRFKLFPATRFKLFRWRVDVGGADIRERRLRSRRRGVEEEGQAER